MKAFLLSFIFLSLFGCDTQKKDKVITANTDSVNTKIVAPEQVVVTRVVTTPEKIDFSNSPYLIIRLSSNRYHLYFHQDSLTTSNIRAVDKFIAQRIKSLNKEKTLLIGEPDGSLKNFKDLKVVLKKYEIYRFRIKTADEVY